MINSSTYVQHSRSTGWLGLRVNSFEFSPELVGRLNPGSPSLPRQVRELENTSLAPYVAQCQPFFPTQVLVKPLS